MATGQEPIRIQIQALESPWGPMLAGSRPRAAYRLNESVLAGHGELVGA